MWQGTGSVLIAIAALLLFIIIFAGLSSCSSMFSGAVNGVVGTSYTSEDSDLVAVGKQLRRYGKRAASRD